MEIYGDLDFSLIDEMPKGRKKVITKIVPLAKREETYRFIREEIKKGRQAFVICPRIEPSTTFDSVKSGGGFPSLSDGNFRHLVSGINKLSLSKSQLSWAEVKTVKEEYQRLTTKIFPDLKIAMLHGKIKPEKKEAIMADISDHALILHQNQRRI